MTLWVNRSGQQITIGSSFGIGSAYHKYEITEHYTSLEHFWSQLGEQLKEAKRRAEAEQLKEEADVVAFVEVAEAEAVLEEELEEEEPRGFSRPYEV